MGLAEYLSSPSGQHTVVHELGHALGLAHAHQNPEYDAKEIAEKLLAPEDIAREIERIACLGEGALDKNEAIQEVTGRWPGDARFSDWVEPAGGIETLCSVMTYAYFDRLLRSSDNAGQFQQKIAGLLKGVDATIVRPQPVDVEQLELMYWPSADTCVQQ
jgi:hypothetical protein